MAKSKNIYFGKFGYGTYLRDESPQYLADIFHSVVCFE
jgi:hypothetical protein